MPVLETKGAASAQGFGLTLGGAAPVYVEDVFQTWLYTGNGSTQTITNGIDLAGKGGLVWIKRRTTSAAEHNWTDTVRGAGKILQSSTTGAQLTTSSSVNTFNANGFFLDSNASAVNLSGEGYVSWTFREQPKFFDVVTYTGTGANRTIAHNLGATPGCIIVKKTSGADNWMVYHRSVAASDFLMLNATNAAINGSTIWNSTAPTSTVFSVGTDTSVNQSGATYVAYLFAHNAGGFGLTGTDNVISCGSYTGTGALQTINLGYEAQFVLIKSTNAADDWYMFDVMRGFVVCPGSGNTPTGDADAALRPNTSGAEQVDTWGIDPAPNGFTVRGNNVSPSGTTYIYIAIRRGPMRTPTIGTSVFAPVTYSGTGSATNITTGVVTDAAMIGARQTEDKFVFGSRLTANRYMLTAATVSELTSPAAFAASNTWSYMNGFRVGDALQSNSSGYTYVAYGLQRAPGFFDEVCYTASGVNPTNISHNLAVAPELMIIKKRSAADTWTVYAAVLGANKEASLNNSGTPTTNANVWNNTAPTATVFTVGLSGAVNESGQTYVAYLFATCPGVSKVGSYTGTGATQTINCGFTGGARFVLIKRTNNVGDWRVWDTARGMVAGTDPRLALNLTDAELNNNWVYTTASGFQIVTSDTSVNASGSTYLFLAIA
jgi:hypothetical protein